MDDGNMGGVGSNLAISLAVDFWFISFDSSAAKQVFDLSDGGSNNDHISVFTSSANENLTLVIAAGGTTTVNALATSGDDVSGAKISFEMTAATNDVETFDGGASVLTDTSVTMPDDIDELDIGQDRASGVRMHGIIERLRIWPMQRRVPYN